MNAPTIYRGCSANKCAPRNFLLLRSRRWYSSDNVKQPVLAGQRGARKAEASLNPFQFLPPPEKKSDPLRILFFGTDDFSIASLSALHRFRQELDIRSIDVACKAPRRAGRGLKVLNEAPIKKAAEELSLPVHEIEQLTDEWQLPTPDDEPINLLIAVSFGLLIPGELITRTKYGGLNLHPSALPDLRGAAPIHRALLDRRRATAVSLQTLHTSKFDHGAILARTGSISIPAEIRWSGQADALRALLAPLGANLLVRSIYRRLFVPPVHEVPLKGPAAGSGLSPGGIITPAPKITAADRRVDWLATRRSDILHRRRVLGPLWSMLSYVEKRKGHPDTPRQVRVVLRWMTNMEPLLRAEGGGAMARLPKPPGTLEVITLKDTKHLVAWTANERLLGIAQMTVEGDRNGRDPIEALTLLRTGDPSEWPKTMKFS